jgi:flavin-dependent trigonelline monooxygenase, reductase component
MSGRMIEQMKSNLSQAAPTTTGALIQVGAILEHRTGLVLLESEYGLQLPTGVKLKPGSDVESLGGVLPKLGLETHLEFIFAVFESCGGPSSSVSVIYRGRVSSSLSAMMNSALHIVPLSRIPYSKLRDEAVRSMLRRYMRERDEGAFGIYVGDAEAGTVRALAAAH